VREGKSPAGGCSLRARRPPPQMGDVPFRELASKLTADGLLGSSLIDTLSPARRSRRTGLFSFSPTPTVKPQFQIALSIAGQGAGVGSGRISTESSERRGRDKPR
jgi:hypothetical protein